MLPRSDGRSWPLRGSNYGGLNHRLGEKDWAAIGSLQSLGRSHHGTVGPGLVCGHDKAPGPWAGGDSGIAVQVYSSLMADYGLGALAIDMETTVAVSLNGIAGGGRERARVVSVAQGIGGVKYSPAVDRM